MEELLILLRLQDFMETLDKQITGFFSKRNNNLPFTKIKIMKKYNSSAKLGQLGFAKALAREGEKRNIFVNTIGIFFPSIFLFDISLFSTTCWLTYD